MTGYRNARDLQDEIERVVGHDVEAVTVNHAAGDIAIEGVSDAELERIHRDVDPRAEAGASFRRGPPEDRGNGGGDARR